MTSNGPKKPGQSGKPGPSGPSGRSGKPRKPGERLQKGGPKQSRPRKPKQPPMSMRERISTLPDRWKRRRAIKKRRLAKMSRRNRVLRRIAIIATCLLGAFALFLSTVVVLFYTLSDVPRPETLTLPKTVRILYADGTQMALQYTQNRTIVSLNQVPEQVRWDVLAAEDRGFYSEPGVSIKGTVRALFSDLTGGDTQGGSGITQQYVKNAYLNSSRSITRKIKELMISVKLSREYAKNQILEFYLNTVYFGRGAYGIQAASHTFFHEDVSKLTTEQGAVLAALLRAPGYYDPTDNPTAAQQRWKYVLDGMVATKHLTAAQEAAMKYPDVLPVDNGTSESGPTDLIVQRVIAELQAHGISKDEMYQRGLTIKTTLDHKAQSDAVIAIRNVFANLTAQQRNMKNALVAIDPATGGVLAYYGGPDGKNYAGKQDGYDYAGVGTRPPGSSFKPYTLATVLTQTLGKAPGKKPLTINSQVDGSFCTMIQGKQICNDQSDKPVSSSSVTIANAMKYSLNTTFDQLAVEAGPNNVADTAHKAGISKTDSDGTKTLQDANGDTGFDIGIGGYAVHPIDQAVGFATFANGGTTNAPYFVQSATDSNGVIVYQHKAAGTRSIDPRVANDVTLTMEPIADYSRDGLTGGRVSAAKTGTQGIPGGVNAGNSDAWMVGYTPQVSVAVWVGSGNSTTPIYNSSGGAEYGRDLPGRTWQMFMNTYLDGKPNMPMATTQMITGGLNVAPTPTKVVTTTPTPSKTPTRTAPATTVPVTPTIPPTTPVTDGVPTTPVVTPTCGGVFGPTCPPTTP